MMKQNHFTKTAAVIVAVFILLSSVPVFGSAPEGGKCGPSLFWEFEESSGTLSISGTGKMYDFTPYSEVYGAAPWYYLRSKVKIVNIGEGCTSVGDNAFYYFTWITEINFPNSLISIGENAFSKCNELSYAFIPDSVTTVGEGAFRLCQSLKYIEFGKGVTYLPPYACDNCEKLLTASLSENCTSLGMCSFQSCISLVNIDLSHITSFGYYSFFNCASLKSAVINKDITTISEGAFGSCTSLSDVRIEKGACPEIISSTSFKSTPFYNAFPDGTVDLFGGCVLMTKGTYTASSLKIPKGTKVISAAAYSNSSNLSDVTIPDSVVVINENAFYNCQKLKTLFIPESVTYLGNMCFGYRAEYMDSCLMDGVTVTSHGFGAPQLYAAANLIGYKCLHSFEYITETEDCTVGSVRKLVCTYCGTCTEKTELPPQEHSLICEKTEATCTEPGMMVTRCTECDFTDSRIISPAKGHTPDNKWTVVSMPDCENDGLVSILCTECGEPLEKIDLESKGHIPSSEITVISEATCTEDGKTARACTVCGKYIETFTEEKKGHTPEAEPHILTVADDGGGVRGCAVIFCSECHEILEIFAYDEDGKRTDISEVFTHDPKLLKTLVTSNIGNVNIESLDYFDDGVIDAKDILTFRRIKATAISQK